MRVFFAQNIVNLVNQINLTPPLRTALLHCARLLNDEINQLLLPYQLNMSLWQVIYVIEQKQGCTAIEIVQYLNISKPAVSKRVQALINLGLIELQETSDKRQKKIKLSAQGQ